MANTRQSAKRARQNETRQTKNTKNRSLAKTAVKKALEAIQTKDLNLAKDAYKTAIKALDKAASKGAIPAGRASRKIARLTQFIKKSLPNVLAK